MAEVRMRKWRLGGKRLGLEFDGKGRLRWQFLFWERLGSSRVERRKAKAVQAKKRAALRAAQTKLRAQEKQAVARAVTVQRKALPSSGQATTQPMAGLVLPASHPYSSPQAMRAAGFCGAPTSSGGHCLNRGNCPHHTPGRRP